ncbi:PepSY-associated TM helix domain-containing protein [Rubellimicrobium arenae]|uniref:PepSY-associated TM helix domain-containing protein n=1 Tax=Rubellimicrobium arenae TaxID=2817372 RepID=UPI001B314DDB|nr:PepSY domain-containing protein [Rubellimicrobium arenae]
MTAFPNAAPAVGGAPASVASASSPRLDKLYFAAWRWHFYAGLFVIPFLLMLAGTGFGMMLLSSVWPEYGERLVIEPAAQALSVEGQVAAALAAVPGGTAVSAYATAYAPGNPVLVTVAGPETPVVVALNPYTGEALRLTADGQTWEAWLEDIHGTLLIGTLGDRLIEIASGLGFVLLATGLYLWWPRGGRPWRDLLVPRMTARGRSLWKSLHTVVGFWVSAALLVFLLTGMAWTGVWGGKWVQAWSTFPAGVWGDAPASDLTHASLNLKGEKRVPWGLEQTPLPQSDPAAASAHHAGPAQAAMDHAGHQHHGMTAGPAPDLTAIVTLGQALDLPGRIRIDAPKGDTGVWTISHDSMSYDSNEPTSDRTVHVDRYSGAVLADLRYEDYSLAAKGLAVGVAMHEGQLGLWNVLVNAVMILLIAFLCVSGLVVWWKRRPTGAMRLAAPPRPEELPLWKGALALAVALSMLFPLVGATLIGVLVLDMLVLQNVKPLKRALS